MKRRALLIGSPLSGKNFLVGVKDDIENFHRFLTSSIGGGYTRDEIVYLKHPSVSDIRYVLNSFVHADIMTVYFSGHGFRKNNEDYICLAEKSFFPVKSLLIPAKRHQIFIDACRTPIDTRFIGDVISGIGFHFSTDNIGLARRLHHNYIEQSPLGGSIIFSTSKNQPSFDSESGGVYTKSLMTALHNWSNTQHEKLITVNQIFQKSSAITRKYEPTQIPKIYYHKNQNALHMPIGINPEAHLKPRRKRGITREEILRALISK